MHYSNCFEGICAGGERIKEGLLNQTILCESALGLCGFTVVRPDSLFLSDIADSVARCHRFIGSVPALVKGEFWRRRERAAPNVSVDRIDRDGGHLYQNILGTCLWNGEVTILDYIGRAELFDKGSLHAILLIVDSGVDAGFSIASW